MKSSAPKVNEPVANWILMGVIMLLIQVILGGITRLTGSGLSITEWNVVTGTLPPLTNDQWLIDFNKYKATPQFQLINSTFTLSDFKFIFFWEWFHRLWARLIGFVFIVGFLYLLAKRHIKKEMVYPLLTLFFLGALQGVIGWIMVLSGLTGSEIYVEPIKLGVHFIFALGLIAYAFWFLLRLRIAPHEKMVVFQALKNFTWLLTTLLFIQLFFGALMAGLKAAQAAPTWPDINGILFPSDLWKNKPVLLNLVENKITVQFAHRALAYVLTALVLIWSVIAFKYRHTGNIYRFIIRIPLLLILVQVLLGIFTVLMSSYIVPNQWGRFEWLALVHQVMGMLLLLSLIAALFVLRNKSSPHL